jgi:uncharacterized protein YukE
MGGHMLIADVGIVANAMTVLQVEPDLVADITELLLRGSEDLDGSVISRVAAGWFGGAETAHRLGVNAAMAHQSVEEEFQKLADSLRQYSDALHQWADDVRDVDATSGTDLVRRSAALEQVAADLAEARDESSTDVIGDGRYTAPTGVPAPATGEGA